MLNSRRIFGRSLLAILLGNAIYFLVLMPHLPECARHQPNRLDWGLLVDFWICVATFAALELTWPRRQ